MSLLKGFTSLFDWMFPKTLDESMQELYDNMNWGPYKAYPTSSAFNMAIDTTSTGEQITQTIYANQDTLNQFLKEELSMKLTNKDLDILYDLVQDKLKEIDYGPEGIEVHQRPEVYINILKKLEEMYS